MTATCEELLLEVLLEHAADLYGSDTGSEDGLVRQERGAETERDTETAEVREDETCAEIWWLVSRLWRWFEDHELCTLR